MEKLNGDIEDDLVVLGNQPFKEYNGVPLKPKASSKCSKCGKCIDRCPVGAINSSNPMETDKKNVYHVCVVWWNVLIKQES